MSPKAFSREKEKCVVRNGESANPLSQMFLATKQRKVTMQEKSMGNCLAHRLDQRQVKPNCKYWEGKVPLSVQQIKYWQRKGEVIKTE